MLYHGFPFFCMPILPRFSHYTFRPTRTSFTKQSPHRVVLPLGHPSIGSSFQCVLLILYTPVIANPSHRGLFSSCMTLVAAPSYRRFSPSTPLLFNNSSLIELPSPQISIIAHSLHNASLPSSLLSIAPVEKKETPASPDLLCVKCSSTG
jgi:hypothetical protein